MSTALQTAGSIAALIADQAHAIGVDAYIYFYATQQGSRLR